MQPRRGCAGVQVTAASSSAIQACPGRPDQLGGAGSQQLRPSAAVDPPSPVTRGSNPSKLSEFTVPSLARLWAGEAGNMATFTAPPGHPSQAVLVLSALADFQLSLGPSDPDLKVLDTGGCHAAA